MNSIFITFVTLIAVSLVSTTHGQGKRSIDAKITGWEIHIDHSDIDNLPPGTNPVTRVQISHPSVNLKAKMEVPFESFFSLWEHLDATSDAEVVHSSIELPVGKDAAILSEKDESREDYKVVASDEAVLLLRFWLDVFKHRWVDDPTALSEDQSKWRGAFGYLLRHNSFPAEGNYLAKFTEEFMAEQQKKPNKAEMATPRKPSD